MNSSDTITFVLDGKLHTIRFDNENSLKPSTTVLNYLRSLPGHKGVKEGCAEGDCGACTVVIASVDENRQLVYQPIDSCLVFLPMIHGKQLITVENLKDNNKLHPVQQAMVDHSGSQCGYCTPGFIMSMFALYKTHNHPSEEVVLDALTGNLCRCTGYQPIVSAAHSACCNNGHDHLTDKEYETIKLLEQINNSLQDKELKGDGQLYFVPFGLNSALSLRARYPDAVVVSGATDIALRQTKKHEHFNVIIDLSAVKELKHFKRTDSHLTIGAGMNLERVKSLVKEVFPPLYSMLEVFGSLQIRTMATLGGNIASASPIADTLPFLFVTGATVKLGHAEYGERTMPVDEFIIGYRKTAIRHGELLVSVTIPFIPPGTKVSSYKISRRKDLDISTLSVAFFLTVNDEGIVNEIRIAYGGMAEITKYALDAENFLKGRHWNEENVKQAAELVEQEFTPLSDARADKEVRLIGASNLLLKFFEETVERAARV